MFLLQIRYALIAYLKNYLLCILLFSADDHAITRTLIVIKNYLFLRILNRIFLSPSCFYFCSEVRNNSDRFEKEQPKTLLKDESCFHCTNKSISV